MKINKFLFLILFSMVVMTTEAQNWRPLVSGTNQSLLSIVFSDVNTGYAVGTGGTILKTTDSGAHWTQQLSGANEAFYSTFFTSAQDGWAVGDAGTIVFTHDGGNTWQSAGMLAGFAALRVVWFRNANEGYIAGGYSGTDATIIKTTDGGATWQDISPNTGQVIYGIWFTDQQIGYASDFDGRILKTLDGGATWSDQFVSPNNLHSISFTDANTGYVCGGSIGADSGVILKTTDAGNTWTEVFAAPAFLTDIKFVDANNGFAAGGSVSGNTSLLLKTADAGNTWTIETVIPGPSTRQFRMFMLTPQLGFSCGLNGAILRKPGLFHVPDPEEATVYCVTDAQTPPTPPDVINSCGDPAAVSGPVVSPDPVCTGDKTYTWTYTDCDGNTADWVFTVHVEAPLFYLPLNGESTVDCLAKATVEPVPPVVINSCGEPAAVSGPIVSPDPVCSGIKTYTWTYSNCSGTSEDWVYTYTIEPPTFVVPDPGGTTVACLAAAQTVPTPPAVVNNCGEAASVSGPVVSPDPVCSGVKTYTWTYTDCSGNTADWTYTYTVQQPTFVLPAPASSTVTCAQAQVAPVPPVVIGSCGNPVAMSGPVIVMNPNCTGTATYTWTYTDCTGNSAKWVYTYTILSNQPTACDVKEIGCAKFEILGIEKDAHNNHKFKVRVTNNCSSKLSYFAVQLPNGVNAVAPLNNDIFTADSGRKYKVRNPNYSPFYSVRFSSQADSIANGQSEIFEYSLPPQASLPTFIHAGIRLASGVFYEVHLNTFDCTVGSTGNREEADNRSSQHVLELMQLYPNPNAGDFMLSWENPSAKGLTFRIMDITGKCVKTIDAAAEATEQHFQLNELPAGLYFLQVYSDGKLMETQKFVKQE